MGFNSMFSALASEGENSDRIFYKNGVKVKHMSGKQPITFCILPALNPQQPDKSISYLPSILPDGQLSDWGKSAYVYRGIGHSDDWKDRCDVVSLTSVGEECPMDILYRQIKNDPTWQYLTDDGKWGDPNRVRATLPPRRLLLFCNVFLPNEPAVSHIGIFSKAVAQKLVGDNGLVLQPSMATEEQVKADYISAYANGDITSPQAAPAFIVEKGHDKGDMSAYELKFALDSSRRVARHQMTRDILASRYDITDIRSYLNILTADQIVQLLIRELNGRSPAGYHEHALLKLAFGSRWQIPEPPSAPAATSTIASGFDASKAETAPVTTPIQPPTQSQAPATTPSPVAPPQGSPTAGAEVSAALSAAVKAGAVKQEEPAQPLQQPQGAAVTGDPIPKFDKDAFLARLAKGGKQ